MNAPAKSRTKSYAVVISFDGIPCIELAYRCNEVSQVKKRFMSYRGGEFVRRATVGIYQNGALAAHGNVNYLGEWTDSKPPKGQLYLAGMTS